jgi:alanyl-tRNA synthetase
LRRFEAVTGVDALSFISSEERVLQDIASSLKVAPSDLGDRVSRLVDEVKELRREVSKSQASIALIEANEFAALAQDQFLVLRRDGLANDDLRRLAVATLAAMESGIVGLIGLTPDGAKGAIAVAISSDLIAKGVSAHELASESAQILGGGTGRQADVAVGGGPQVDGIDAAVTSLLKAVTTAKGK